MVFMAKMEKVLLDSEESSSSAKETIAEVSYYTSDSESEFEYETLEYYDNSTNYGLFVNNDDDQEFFHDAIEFASEIFNENHIVSQTDHDQLEVDHNDSKDKDHLVDKLIKKFNQKIAKCQKLNTFEEKNNEFNEQIKVLNETNVDLLAQTEVLQEQLKVKHVVIDTHTECQAQYAKLKEERYQYMIRYSALHDNDKQHRKKIDEQEILFDKMSCQLVEMNNNVLRLQENILEKETKISELEECVSNKDLEIEKRLERLNDCFENQSYFCKAKELRPSLYDERVIGLGYTPMFLTHSNEALEIEKFKRARENKIEFAYDYGNLNASYVNEKINFSDDYFQEIINPDFEKIDSPFQQTSSLKPYVPTVILEKIIIDLEDEVVSLLEKEKENLEIIESLKSKGFESSENAISESENQSENDCQEIEKGCDNLENSKVIAPGMFKINVSQSVSPILVSKTSCASNNVENKTKRKRRKRTSSKQNDKQVNNDVLRANRDFVHFSDLDTLSSVRRPKHSGVIWKKKGSSNTSNVDLSSVSHLKLNKDVKRYSRKDLLSCNNSHHVDTRGAYACNDAMNVSCNSKLYVSCDVNDLFVFDDVSIRKSQVRKMPFRKKPRDSLNIVQICLWIIDSGCSNHMTGKCALLTNFVEKFLGTVHFGNNDFAVIAGYGDVVIGSMTIKKVYYVEEMASKQFSLEPGLSNLNETGKSSNPTISQVLEISKKDLEDLFHNFYDEYFDSSKITKSPTTNVETSNDKISSHEEVFHESSESFQEESSSSSLNDDVQQSSEEVMVPLTNTQSISNNMVPNVNEASSSHNVIEPANVAEALKDVDWVSTMQDELDQFARLKVWRLVPRPEGKTIIKTKWIFKNKKDESSLVIRNKARLVAVGYCQQGIDYDETLQVNQFSNGIFINQSKYILDILKRFGMENCDTVPTPMVEQAKLKLDLVGKPVDHTDYRSMIGSLMYLTSSRPDIMFATCLWYPKDYGFDLTAYSDADHAGCHLDRKSTSGSVQFLGDKLVCWSSKKQNCVSISTAESEYVAVSGCCAQVLWMRTQLTDYGFFFDKVPIYCDSKSAIAISCNPVQHTRTKHIDVRYHFIKDHVEKGTIELYFVGTEFQLADLFTKSLPEARFKFLVEKLGMMSRET
ncbi:integrase, catalytic region, zinc finger, CCHC-type containing protein [Tanacetum coccineum]|uniref:Integrase, catalytic region, zinc finger, CCHC-type containing protein n=1 Tax=Tanacetum coccineum TaxID=301880 RepID=A0ABQ4XD76_9ASTR